jgi:hypothetical protein
MKASPIPSCVCIISTGERRIRATYPRLYGTIKIFLHGIGALSRCMRCGNVYNLMTVPINAKRCAECYTFTTHLPTAHRP